MKFLLIEDLDIHIRERSAQIATFERAGSRILGESRSCAFCRRQPWPRRIESYEAVRIVGDRVLDAVYRLGGGPFLVSRRFITEWESSGMSGLSFSQPVPVKGADVILHLSFPEQAILRFADDAGAVYRRTPSCRFCMSAEVTSLSSVRFEPSHERICDVFMPSCLPGRIVATQRFFEFVSTSKIGNFFFSAGFDGGEAYTARGVLFQKPDCSFSRYEALDNTQLESLYGDYWAGNLGQYFAT